MANTADITASTHTGGTKNPAIKKIIVKAINSGRILITIVWTFANAR